MLYIYYNVYVIEKTGVVSNNIVFCISVKWCNSCNIIYKTDSGIYAVL